MRGLLLTSAIIIMVAVSAPSLLTRYLDGAGASAVRAPSREALVGDRTDEVVPVREGSPASPSRQVEVEADPDGHFYVDADVNFRTVRLMVDTGATVVALRESDAETAGLRMRPDDFVHPVQTANGTANAAEAMLDSVSIDDVEVRNVRALVLPDSQLAISLLGGSFLNGLERFEIADGTLVMEE